MTAFSTVPLKLLNSNGDLKQLTTAEELVLCELGCIKIISQYDSVGARYGGSLTTANTALDSDVGPSQFTNTFYNQPVGTHPASSLSIGSVSYPLRQMLDSVDDLPWNSSTLDLVVTDSDGDLYVMDSASFETFSTRIAEQFVSNELPGTFRLSKTAPTASGWQIWIPNIYTDTKSSGGPTDTYSIWRKESSTLYESINPLKHNGGINFQESTDSETSILAASMIKYGFEKGGIGEYELRTSAEGAPTASGTWEARGTAVDTRYTTQNLQYTSAIFSGPQFTGTFSSQFTGVYVGYSTTVTPANFSGVRTLNFAGTRAQPANFAGTRSVGGSANYSGVRTVNFSGTRSGNFAGVRDVSFSGVREVSVGAPVPAQFSGPQPANFAGTRDVTQPGTFTGGVDYYGGDRQYEWAGRRVVLPAFGGYRNPFVGFYTSAYQFYATQYLGPALDQVSPDGNQTFPLNNPGLQFGGTGYWAGTRVIPQPGNFAGVVTAQFAGTVISNFTGPQPGNFSGPQPATFSGAQPANFAGPQPANFVGGTGNFAGVATYSGTRSSNFAGVAQVNFSGSRAANFSGSRTYATSYTAPSNFTSAPVNFASVPANYTGGVDYYGGDRQYEWSGSRSVLPAFGGYRNPFVGFYTSSYQFYATQYLGPALGQVSPDGSQLVPINNPALQFSGVGFWSGTRNFAGTRTFAGVRGFSGSRTYSTNFGASIPSNFLGPQPATFSGVRSGNFSSPTNYSGTRVVPGNFAGTVIVPGNFAGPQPGNFAGTITQNFIGYYAGQYTGNFTSQFSTQYSSQYTGETLVAVSADIETYTLYVRVGV
jgi:hypothetical protein